MINDLDGIGINEIGSSGENSSFINYDFDGSGDITLANDGLIGLRKISGTFPGDALTDGSLSTAATVNTEEIDSSLNDLITQGAFDLDQDGLISPLSDGLLMIDQIQELYKRLSSIIN